MKLQATLLETQQCVCGVHGQGPEMRGSFQGRGGSDAMMGTSDWCSEEQKGPGRALGAPAFAVLGMNSGPCTCAQSLTTKLQGSCVLRQEMTM